MKSENIMREYSTGHESLNFKHTLPSCGVHGQVRRDSFPDVRLYRLHLSQRNFEFLKAEHQEPFIRKHSSCNKGQERRSVVDLNLGFINPKYH